MAQAIRARPFYQNSVRFGSEDVENGNSLTIIDKNGRICTSNKNGMSTTLLGANFTGQATWRIPGEVGPTRKSAFTTSTGSDKSD